MPLQPSDDVRGETSVEPGRVNSAADDVDGSPLGDAHGPGRCRRRAVWDLEGTCVSWTPPSQILRSTERWNIAERLNRDGPTSPAARASDSARRAGFRLRPLRGLPTSPAARASSRQPSPVGMVALAGRRRRPSRSSPDRASAWRRSSGGPKSSPVFEFAARWSDFARCAGFRLRPLRGLPTPPAARASSRQPSPVGMVALAGRRSRPSRSSAKPSEGWLAALDDFRNWLIREAA